MNQLVSAALVLGLTLLSGVLDARGFVFASRAWPQGGFDLRMVLLSLASFAGGISLYILAVRFMLKLGVGSVALQTGVWFFATAVALALFDGSIANWSRVQQGVGVALAVGLAWLLVTTAGHEAR